MVNVNIIGFLVCDFNFPTSQCVCVFYFNKKHQKLGKLANSKKSNYLKKKNTVALVIILLKND